MTSERPGNAEPAAHGSKAQTINAAHSPKRSPHRPRIKIIRRWAPAVSARFCSCRNVRYRCSWWGNRGSSNLPRGLETGAAHHRHAGYSGAALLSRRRGGPATRSVPHARRIAAAARVDGAMVEILRTPTDNLSRPDCRLGAPVLLDQMTAHLGHASPVAEPCRAQQHSTAVGRHLGRCCRSRGVAQAGCGAMSRAWGLLPGRRRGWPHLGLS